MFIRGPLNGRRRDAERVVLVMDPAANSPKPQGGLRLPSRFGELSTHSPASLCQAFAPAKAKRLAGRLEVRHAPKHGSRLNRAGIEFAALGRRRPARRIARHGTPRRHVATWEEQRNSAQTKITRQFTTSQARTKLKSLHPSIDG